MAAVTDAEGGLVASASGTDAATYRNLIKLARAKAGFEKDPAKIRKILEKVSSDELIIDGVVGKKIADMGEDPLYIIKKRIWTFKNGKTMKAALLEAKGATGIFVGEDGLEVARSFDDLSAEDIALLQKKLK